MERVFGTQPRVTAVVGAGGAPRRTACAAKVSP